MRTLPSRRARLAVTLGCTIVACLALATPWAEPFRRVLRPALPMLVIVLATVSALAQIVVGAVHQFSRSSGRRAAALPLTLGASALCVALAFLPRTAHSSPRLAPLLGAALFAVTAAALQRRARERSEP